MEKILAYLQDGVNKLLTEKFKSFRSGFVAGGVVSVPFLFHVQGFSHDLIWIFPLKLFMTVTFSFATGIAAKGSADVYNYFKRNKCRFIKFKNKSNGNKKTKDDRAA